MHHLIFGLGGTERIYLQSIEHDYIRILKSQSYKQMSTYSRPDSVGLGIRGSLEAWVLFPLVVTFFTGFFCFHVVKSLMPILALYWHYCQLCLITKKLEYLKSPRFSRQVSGNTKTRDKRFSSGYYMSAGANVSGHVRIIAQVVVRNRTAALIQIGCEFR